MFVRSRRRPVRLLLLISILVIMFVLFSSGCRSPENRITEKTAFDIMDTDIIIKAVGKNSGTAIEMALEEMRRLDELLNVFDPISEVSEINRQAGKNPVSVSEDTFYLIREALYLARLSGGAFDPTIRPLISAWGFGTDNISVPVKEDIETALNLVDYRKVTIDEEKKTVFLEQQGMGLDLGSIAKGYGVDRMADIMKQEGITAFLINAGGNVYAYGVKPDGSPWNIAITDARNPEDFIGILPAEDLSIVSSGDYQRYFIENGVAYHHIMDPETGYPVEERHGTTVLFPSSIYADGLSTALFVLGPENSDEVLSKFPGIGVVFVEKDNVIVKKGIVDNIEFK